MSEFGASYVQLARRLLAFKDPFGAVTNALDLGVTLLDHLFHELFCLLQVIRQHLAVDFVLSQFLVVLLPRLLYELVCTLRSLNS